MGSIVVAGLPPRPYTIEVPPESVPLSLSSFLWQVGHKTRRTRRPINPHPHAPAAEPLPRGAGLQALEDRRRRAAARGANQLR